MADQNPDEQTISSNDTPAAQQPAAQQPAAQPAPEQPDPYGHLSAEDRQTALGMDQKGLPYEMRPDRLVPKTGEVDYSSVSDWVSKAAEDWGRETGRIAETAPEGEQIGDSAEDIASSLTAQGAQGQLVSDPDTAAQIGQIAHEAALTTAEVKQATLEFGQNFTPETGFQALVSKVGDEGKARQMVEAANKTLANHPRVKAFLDANPAAANSPSLVAALAE